jgi:hypothetical protein
MVGQRDQARWRGPHDHDVFRGTESLLTRRWREPDSNRPSHLTAAGGTSSDSLQARRRPRNAGVRDGTMSSNPLCSRAELPTNHPSAGSTGNTVREKLLLRIVAQIGEGQHRHRRFVGERQRWWRSRLGGIAGVANPVDPHWPGDVLDLVLAEILKRKRQPVADVVVTVLETSTPPASARGGS